AEYRLRCRYGDRPGLDEYRSRFPAQFRDLAATLGESFGADAPTEGDVSTPARTGVPTGESTDRLQAEAAAAEEAVPADFKYQLIRVLGTGAYGQVYEAEAPGGFRVALKRITRSVDHPTSRGEVEALEAIKATRHPFLLHTQAYWVFRDHL